jgi:hypothetical protein
VATDVIYLDLGASRKATRDFGIGQVDIPATVNANLRLDVTGVWRYLDYDLGDSTPIKSINFNGPALGVTFRF